MPKTIKVTKQFRTIREKGKPDRRELLNHNILTKDHRGKTLHVTKDELDNMISDLQETKSEFDKWLTQER